MRERVVGFLFVVVAFLVVRGSLVAAAQPPDLSGAWVLVEVMPAFIELPLVGRVELTTIVGMLVDIEQTGCDLALRCTCCFQEVRTTPPLVTTVIPERFVAALPQEVIPARLEESPEGWRFVQPWWVDVRGAQLVDPAHEPLPTSPLDPRVIDQDADGHPGLTVHLSIVGLLGGDAYVANRTCTSLEGWLLEDGSITGWVHWSSDQNVLAASDPLFLSSYVYVLDPDPAKHFFLLRPISDPDPCRAIRDSLTSLLSLPPG